MQPETTSRKAFLRMVGGAGAASALSVALASCGDDDDDAATTPARSSGGGDVAIVNYALTLEYLEAGFYVQAIDSGELKDKKVADLARQFGDSEQQHVDALVAAVKRLGGKPVDKPATNFDDVLAGGAEMILTTAASVENLGAAAYLAQAPRIESKEILAAALSIHSVEARHAAALNELIGAGFKGTLPDGAFAKPMDMKAVLAAAKPFLA